MRKSIVWVVICMVFASSLFACGSNSSSDSTPEATYSISGTVTSSSTGLQEVTMTLSSTATTTTDSSGNYSFVSLANGSYTITPSKTGYTFNPTNSTQTINAANVTGVNFTTSSITSDVTGTWNATAVNTLGEGGTFTMNLTQSGTSVSGTVLLKGYTGNLTGSVSGNNISLTIPDPDPACSGSVGTHDGTVIGNTISGSWTSTAGGICTAETGTWSATRQ